MNKKQIIALDAVIKLDNFIMNQVNLTKEKEIEMAAELNIITAYIKGENLEKFL